MTLRLAVMIAALTIAARAYAGDPPAAGPSAVAPPAPTPTTPAATPAPADIVDEDGEPRLSLPTQADRDAWRTGGFRLGLGLVFGDLVGLRGAPSGRLIGPVIRVGLRLDEQWSILTSFEYASASAHGGLSGLRFAGTIDPTWHVTPSLSLSLGFGFGGIVEGRTGRMDADPLPSTLDTSYTFPDARHPIASCSGVGAAGLVRIAWSYVLGPRAQTAVSLEVVGQWTGCVDDTNRIEPDTGVEIVRRQFWPHTGGTLGWEIQWR
ncbi:MAG TPA: hypothetical protein VH165_02330 [Kofleriaceae bacterium]|nr:hypothetical protein [Kofleriaceae bacterium]